MATNKVPIAIFIQELEAALDRHDGYIMGAYGQNPKTGSLDLTVTKEQSAWKTTGWYYTQYNTGYSAAQKKKALYWREHAVRVWDCNGLAEGIYQIHTGININTKARDNYNSWCNPKSTDMLKLPKEPGVAVFKYNTSVGYITHVGYLWKPLQDNNPAGDWWVIEAKGVAYGVVKTRLSTGNWNRWGKMTKYYDYSVSTTSIAEESSFGHINSSVLQIQQLLLNVGEQLPRWGLDGEFGSETKAAIMSFQKKNGLIETGAIDDITMNLLKTQKRLVTIPKGQCWIRSGPGVAHKQLDVAHTDDTFLYGGITKNNWHSIIYDNTNIAYVSAKYSVVT